ncbi:MAG TPA: CorA family divalent cation transporter, partial [Kofleriaceae bacterium]|nr:CorA family divalent cation transporter [Kofleriaceae bacterium]
MQARILDGDKLRTTTSPAEIRTALEANQRIWIDLERQSTDADALLGDVLKLHPLTIEDIWAERSRPKIDDFDPYLYLIVHGIGAAKHDKLQTVELDIVIGPNWLVTHDPAGLVSDDVGTELDHTPRLLVKGVAWVAHALLDRAVDGYMPVIDQLDTEIEQLENDTLD